MTRPLHRRREKRKLKNQRKRTPELNSNISLILSFRDQLDSIDLLGKSTIIGYVHLNGGIEE